VDALDCYMLHWSDAWAYQGPLCELAERPPDEQEALTVPTDEDGDPETVDAALSETWQRMETLHDRGLARTLGICNVPVEQLSSLCATARVPPAIVQVERHPYRSRTRLVDWCHRRGIRVVAHTPLAGGDVLGDAVVRDIAADRGVSPAAVVLAWHVRRGVVPIPSSNDPDHVVGNLAASRRRPTAEELARIDALGAGEGST
jgi:alcohol dehydrogenase (NADP+)